LNQTVQQGFTLAKWSIGRIDKWEYILRHVLAKGIDELLCTCVSVEQYYCIRLTLKAGLNPV